MIPDTPSSSPVAATPLRYERVQVLRFFAALGVVLYHASTYVQSHRPNVASPFVRFFDYHFSWGVQLFFVISGFIIAHTVERMSVAEFARRRFLRIYPAYWIAVLLVLSTKLLIWGWDPSTRIGEVGLALTLLPVGQIPYPLAVEWTLVYEVFFYIMVGTVALAGWHRARDALCVVWLSAIAIDFVWRPFNATIFLPTIAQIFFSAFNLPFIVGMIVHRVHLLVPDAARKYALLAAPALVLGTEVLAAHTEIRLLLVGLGFGALVLWAVLADRRGSLAAGNPLVALGDWSYGLYLMHVPVITILLATGVGKTSSGELLFAGLAAIAVAAGSVFGAFEAALHRLLLRLTRRNRSLDAQLHPGDSVPPEKRHWRLPWRRKTVPSTEIRVTQ